MIEKQNNLPLELTERNQWMTWRDVEGRKIPNGKSNDVSTWCEFKELEHFDKIAFVFSANDPYCGVDLDDCIEDGELLPWAVEIMDRFRGSAYAEYSPSGTGVKLITRAKKPSGSRCSNGKGVECYDHSRFWTITREVVPGFEMIGDGQAAIEWLIEAHLPSNPVEAVKPKPAQSSMASPFSSSRLMVRAQAYADNADRPEEGGRNNAAFRLAGGLLALVEDGAKLSQGEVLELVSRWNSRLTKPLTWNEVDSVVQSAAKNGTPRECKPTGADRPHLIANGLQSTANGSQLEGTDEIAIPAIESIQSLWDSHPKMRLPVIDGILRKGETCNIIASPKVGKSFLAGGLAWSVAQGKPWMGFDTVQGKVLVIDNELHPETLSARYGAIANAMGIESEFNRNLDVLPLRGFACGVRELDQFIDSKAGAYSLVIIDAFYRTLPEGSSENDNAQMMQIYNHLDRFAAKLDAAIVVVHHSSKGDQSLKGITDMGSGAGAISRAADTHIAIRPHEDHGFAVMEAVTRSWKSPEPVTIAWDYPLWNATVKEARLKQANGLKEAKQSARDKETDGAVLEEITKSKRPLSIAELRSRTGWQNDRLQRSVNRLQKDGKITSKRTKSKATGKSAERYFLEVVCSSGCSPKSDAF